MSDDVRLSVALVTRNRPESLARTLRSLRAQAMQPFEVVISDDSDESNGAAIRRLAQAYGCRYVTGPRRGLYANRNRAALACRGTHVRTMDDDHEFPPQHLEACLAAVRRDPTSVWVIGELNPGEEGHKHPRGPGQLHARGYAVAPADPDSSWAISDGASIYPRALFDHPSTRYAEAFVFGASYLELGSRLEWLGVRIRELNTTYVIHHYDAARRSIDDRTTELASRVFAMLCHSRIYRRQLANQFLTDLELLKQALVHPVLSARAMPRGYAAYRWQRLVFADRGRTRSTPRSA